MSSRRRLAGSATPSITTTLLDYFISKGALRSSTTTRMVLKDRPPLLAALMVLNLIRQKVASLSVLQRISLSISLLRPQSAGAGQLALAPNGWLTATGRFSASGII